MSIPENNETQLQSPDWLPSDLIALERAKRMLESGRTADAEKLYLRTLQYKEALYGSSNPALLPILEVIHELHHSLQNVAAADQIAERIRIIRTTPLPNQSESIPAQQSSQPVERLKPRFDGRITAESPESHGRKGVEFNQRSSFVEPLPANEYDQARTTEPASPEPGLPDTGTDPVPTAKHRSKRIPQKSEPVVSAEFEILPDAPDSTVLTESRSPLFNLGRIARIMNREGKIQSNLRSIASNPLCLFARMDEVRPQRGSRDESLFARFLHATEEFLLSLETSPRTLESDEIVEFWYGYFHTDYLKNQPSRSGNQYEYDLGCLVRLTNFVESGSIPVLELMHNSRTWIIHLGDNLPTPGTPGDQRLQTLISRFRNELPGGGERSEMPEETRIMHFWLGYYSDASNDIYQQSER